MSIPSISPNFYSLSDTNNSSTTELSLAKLNPGGLGDFNFGSINTNTSMLYLGLNNTSTSPFAFETASQDNPLILASNDELTPNVVVYEAGTFDLTRPNANADDYRIIKFTTKGPEGSSGVRSYMIDDLRFLDGGPKDDEGMFVRHGIPHTFTALFEQKLADISKSNPEILKPDYLISFTPHLLRDQGTLVQVRSRYRPKSPVSALEVRIYP